MNREVGEMIGRETFRNFNLRERRKREKGTFSSIFFPPPQSFIYFASPFPRMSSRFWQFATAGNRDCVCGFSTPRTFSPASRANCGFEAITGLIIAWNVIIIVATHREKEISTIVPACNFARFLPSCFAFLEYFSIPNGNLFEIAHSFDLSQRSPVRPTWPEPLNKLERRPRPSFQPPQLHRRSRHLADPRRDWRVIGRRGRTARSDRRFPETR